MCLSQTKNKKCTPLFQRSAFLPFIVYTAISMPF
nr:MAG TPA: hypothetical protein [Caudoviricetes sp.]DAV38961.1 MAG TPA: hypothetical protein [Caudoviricetes sp.]